MFNVFPASSEHLHFGWPAGTGPWSPSSGKLSTKGPSETGRPSPCLSGVGWNTPRAGTEEPEAMFPFLVGTTQRWRKGGLYCLPPFVT